MEQKNKLDFIDALRGYAIFFVIFAHTGQMEMLNYPNHLKTLYGFGPRGVQLFFIVSAITLFLSGERTFSTEQKPIVSFYIRRYFRIAPLYYLGLIFYSFLLNDYKNIDYKNVLGYIFFINNLYPHNQHLVPGGWSISSEMIFYIFVPYLFKHIKTLQSAVLFTLFSLLIATLFHTVSSHVSFGFNKTTWSLFTPYFILNSIPVFGIGISFYYIILKKDYKIDKSLILVILFLLLFNSIFQSGFINIYIQSSLFGLIALVLSKAQLQLINNLIVRHFGKISYSMYITHFFVLEMIAKFKLYNYIPLDGSIKLIAYFLLKLAITIVVTSIISSILFNLVELPFQSLGRRCIKAIKPKRILIPIPNKY